MPTTLLTTRVTTSLLLACSLTAACHDASTARHTHADPDGARPELTGDAGDSPSEGDATLNTRADDATSANGEPLPEPTLEVGETFATRDPAYLFDQDVVRTFELRLSEGDLATLDADPTAEQYVRGSLAFEGGLIPDVGIRYKGSTGGFVGCLSGGYFPPTGSKTCVKLGMKVKIDYEHGGARFFGQKKVQFHAMNLDRSLLRERFGYALYNTLDVHAPRTAHVRLLVNGQLVGVFLLVEVVEGPFTRSRFADGGKGNLYKEAWPVGNDEARYLAAIESSGSDTPSAAKIIAFADELAAADDSTLPGVVERWLDPDYLARFIAVDRALRHDDGPHHWYCGSLAGEPPAAWHQQRTYAGLSCGNHNYFWYEDATADRLWPIPWDLDNAITVGTTFTGLTGKWDDLTADCSAVLSGLLGQEMPTTCDPLHRGIALSQRARVRAVLEQLAAGPLSEANIDAQLAPWIAQLEPLVAEANAAHPSELDVEGWQSQLAALRAAISTLRDQALAAAQ